MNYPIGIDIESDSQFYLKQETVPGVQLESYTKRVPSEDGTYVVVTSHSERIEKIPQPLTPEELAAQKKAEKIALMVVGGVAAAFFTLIGVFTYLDEKEKKYQRSLQTADGADKS